MGMRFERILPLPQEVKEKYPISQRAAAAKERVDAEIKNILCGNDKRLLLIIGPCSADNEEAVLEYVHRLKEVQEQVREKLRRAVKTLDERYCTVVNVERSYTA